MAIEQTTVEETPAVVTPPVEPAPIVTPPVDDPPAEEPKGFDDVFAQWTENEDEAGNMPLRTDNPDAKEAAAKPDAAAGIVDEGLPTPEEVAAADAAEAPAGDPSAEEAPAADAPAETPAADQDILNKLADLVKRQPAEEPQQPAPAAVEQPDVLEGIYTAEEQQQLVEYAKEWGEVSKGEELKRRAEYTLLANHIFEQISEAIMPQFETLHALADQIHLKDLNEKVEDYPVVREKVIEWVGKQPDYLQTAYNHVINNGTTEEVTDLIGRYKQETGVVTPAAKADPAPAPAKKPDTGLPTATKKAAASLAPVSSKRSTVVSGQDPDDFDGAFASFADKV